MPKQPAFPGLRDAIKKKQTRRELFISEMDAVAPWGRLLVLIAQMTRMGLKGGRPTLPLEMMLRVCCLQNWYALSDPMGEETLYDSGAMRRFAGIERRRWQSATKNGIQAARQENCQGRHKRPDRIPERPKSPVETTVKPPAKACAPIKDPDGFQTRQAWAKTCQQKRGFAKVGGPYRKPDTRYPKRPRPSERQGDGHQKRLNLAGSNMYSVEMPRFRIGRV